MTLGCQRGGEMKFIGLMKQISYRLLGYCNLTMGYLSTRFVLINANDQKTMLATQIPSLTLFTLMCTTMCGQYSNTFSSP